MKILVNAQTLLNIRTGIGRYTYQLYKELQTRPGVEVGYFDGINVRREMPGAYSVSSWRLMTNVFWTMPPRLALAVRIVMQWRKQAKFRAVVGDFDVYHEPSFFPYTAPEGTKTVVTVHDLSLMRHPQWHPPERVLHFERFFKKMLPLADHFISVSAFTKQEMLDLLDIPASRITSIPLGIDPSLFFPPSGGEIKRVVQKYGLPKRYFLIVGGGDPRKNVDIVPKALARAGLDVPLVVVGWVGWSEDKALLPNSMSLGYVDDADLAPLYGGALATLYPSLYEGYGLPVIEAMACGCLVVTTRLGSLPEAGGGEAIYLRSSDDPDELASILSRLAKGDSEFEHNRKNGLRRTSRQSWSEVADRTLDVFESVLSC
jgi:alpha-1,3-rhamnosyl/mannosyltransferase